MANLKFLCTRSRSSRFVFQNRVCEFSLMRQIQFHNNFEPTTVYIKQIIFKSIHKCEWRLVILYRWELTIKIVGLEYPRGLAVKPYVKMKIYI